MTKGRITPGVWRAVLKQSVFIGPRWHVITEDRTLLVAKICEHRSLAEGESQANARAMALVPEMLKALELARFKLQVDDSLQVVIEGILDRITAIEE